MTVYSKLLLTEASPYFARLLAMLTAQFTKSSSEIKAMRDNAQGYQDGLCDFTYDVKALDKQVNAAEKNNDTITTIMTRCVS